MKTVLKLLVALMSFATGLFLGITLLQGFILWKVLVFAGSCGVIGQFVYKLLRVIDKKYSVK